MNWPGKNRSRSRRLSIESLENRRMLASVQVSDINPGGNAAVGQLVAFDDSIYFTARSDDGGSELFATDGSRSSIRQVSNGAGANYPHVIDDELYFIGDGQLWKTDGNNVESTGDFNLQGDVLLNGQVVTIEGSTWEFTPLDGGTTTEVVLPGIENSSFASVIAIRYVLSSSGEIFIVQSGRDADDASVAKIWVTDGTQQGTRIVDDLRDDGDGLNDASLGMVDVVGDTLVYTKRFSDADGGLTGELHLADSSSNEIVADFAGAEDVSAFSSESLGLNSFEDKLFFYKGEETWQTDGTPEGTRRFSDEVVLPIRSEGDVTYFLAIGSLDAIRFGGDLWRTEGSFEDAVFLAEEVLAERPLEHNGDLFFADNDGAIWRTDGSPDGTGVLADFTGRYSGQSVFHVPEMVVVDGSLFFSGASTEESGAELHRITLDPRWNNPFDAGDVNDDGIVAPLDALLILNELNDRQFIDEAGLIDEDPVANLQLDANADGHISPVDALLAINGLNSGASSAGNASARLSSNVSPDVARSTSARVAGSPNGLVTAELDEEADDDPSAVLIDIIFGNEI